ncbi:MAG: hypothetical protein AABY22_35265, partial [Nanoarchaeota archaeon]
VRWRPALDTWKSKGHTVYLYTCRTNKNFNPPEDPKEQSRKLQIWLDQYNLSWILIHDTQEGNGKCNADIFIDDRAMEYNDRPEFFINL